MSIDVTELQEALRALLRDLEEGVDLPEERIRAVVEQLDRLTIESTRSEWTTCATGILGSRDKYQRSNVAYTLARLEEWSRGE